MRIFACFLYCLFTIGYAWYPYGGSKWTDLFNMCNLLGFIAILCYFLNTFNALTKNEKLFIQFSMFLTICRLLYTTYCVFMNKAWILYNTDVFNVLTAISFAVLLITCATKKS